MHLHLLWIGLELTGMLVWIQQPPSTPTVRMRQLLL
jgi:hypothetical protein